MRPFHRRRNFSAVATVAALAAVAACNGHQTPVSDLRPVTATASAAVAAPVSVAPNVTTSALTQPFPADLDDRIGANVSAEVFDTESGKTWDFHPGLRVYTASIVKVAILAALLHRDLTLPARDSEIATDMIDRSDNDAATTLWTQAGRIPALQTLFDTAGMTATGRAPILLEPWDGVMTTAADQVALLRTLFIGDAYLGAEQQAYLSGLMRNVEADQAWGITAGVPAGATVAVKNGWVQVPGHQWTVNSIGYVHTATTTYYIAILSSNQPDLDTGIATIETVSRAVAAALAAIESSPEGRGQGLTYR